MTAADNNSMFRAIAFVCDGQSVDMDGKVRTAKVQRMRAFVTVEANKEKFAKLMSCSVDEYKKRVLATDICGEVSLDVSSHCFSAVSPPHSHAFNSVLPVLIVCMCVPGAGLTRAGRVLQERDLLLRHIGSNGAPLWSRQ